MANVRAVKLHACPICGTELEVQQWAGRGWVDCASNHRLGCTDDDWLRLCMGVRIDEISAFLGQLPSHAEDTVTTEPDVTG